MKESPLRDSQVGSEIPMRDRGLAIRVRRRLRSWL